ncbi:unnamed protein product [Scytosiphon promiscuus]
MDQQRPQYGQLAPPLAPVKEEVLNSLAEGQWAQSNAEMAAAAAAAATAEAATTSPEPVFHAAAASRPVDLRLQVQAAKLSYVVTKKRHALAEAGFTLRREEKRAGGTGSENNNTVQEFLDRTWAARHVSSRGFGRAPDRSPCAGGSGISAGDDVGSLVPVGYRRDGMDALTVAALRERCVNGSRSGGGGGGEYGGGRTEAMRSSMFETWKDMTFVFCEELGWVFLHQATSEGVEMVKRLFRTVHCQELGVMIADPTNQETIEGLVSALSSCDEVSVQIDGAIAKIAGTQPQVSQVSRAIEAMDTCSQRLHSTGHWYYQGPDVAVASTPPWFAMNTEANERLEDAYVHRRELNLVDSPIQYTAETGVLYTANFTLMTQKNELTGFVRPIKRVVSDGRPRPLPRCPKEFVPLTGFREGSTVSLFDVSEAEDRMVRDAVSFTYTSSVVIHVQHIWNSFLWGHYAQNAKSIGNENLLFHGAPSVVLNTIMRTGFEKRLAGSANGAKFGQGCYFARDAGLASRYMAPPPCGGQMIMAKVLVGESTYGTSDMVVPPKIGKSERHYDSTTNDPRNPSLIVTYKDWQAYPMYLITFEPRGRTLSL